ncbi:hypothetical protein [Lysinibacillus xylanilyticus]|uniref:hypothetical protein n=1 Tax=Lysinibacillus xylanilyticus TaxID=582475 RepID=UPI003D08C21F
MRIMTIQSVKQLVEETNTFTEIAVKAYNTNYQDPAKRLAKMVLVDLLLKKSKKQ